MYSTVSTVYNAKCAARCVASVCEEDRERFVVGTAHVREENEVAVVDFEEETNSLQCVGVFRHPGEVRSLAPSLFEDRRVAICGAIREGFECCLYDAGEAGDWGTSSSELSGGADEEPTLSREASDDWAKSRGELKKLAKLKDACQNGYLRAISWCPKEHEKRHTLCTVDANDLRIWDASGSTTLASPVSTLHSQGVCTGAAWSPHAADEIVVSAVPGLRFFDVRTFKATSQLDRPHDGATLHVDYNPNKPFTLATSGDDGCAKFWDSRSMLRPLKIIQASKEPCTVVKFNKFHDQLLVTASSDAFVHLWRVSSISSAPLLEVSASSSFGGGGDDGVVDDTLNPSEEENNLAISDDDDALPSSSDSLAPDVLVKTFDLHDDAVYSLAWSATDAWAFASLSYDGRLVLNHVPSPEKYKILL